MDALTSQQAIYRMELQMGQLIRHVANLNERVELLEDAHKRSVQQIIQLKPRSHV